MATLPENTTPTLITTSNNPRIETNRNLGNFNRIFDPNRNLGEQSDEATKALDSQYGGLFGQLDALQQRSNQSTSRLIGSLNAKYRQRAAESQMSSERYQAGLKVAGLASGTTKYLPELQEGIIRGAEIEGHRELQNIDDEQQKLLAEAENAKVEKDFDIFNAKMKAYNDLEDRKTAAVKNLYDQMNTERNYKLDAQRTASALATDSLQREKLSQEILKLKLEVGDMASNAVLAMDPKNVSYFNAIKNASIGLPENQREENFARMNALLAQGDKAGASELILRTAFEKLPTGKKEAGINRAQAIGGLTAMKELIDKYKVKTGLVSGTIEDISRALGRTSAADKAKFEQELTLAVQPYRQAVTGAAWGNQETKEYKRIFPSLKNTSKLNSVLIDSLLANFQRNQGIEVGLYTGQKEFNNIFRPVKDLQTLLSQQPELSSDVDRMITENPELTEDDIFQIISEQ